MVQEIENGESKSTKRKGIVRVKETKREHVNANCERVIRE